MRNHTKRATIPVAIATILLDAPTSRPQCTSASPFYWQTRVRDVCASLRTKHSFGWVWVCSADVYNEGGWTDCLLDDWLGGLWKKTNERDDRHVARDFKSENVVFSSKCRSIVCRFANVARERSDNIVLNCSGWNKALSGQCSQRNSRLCDCSESRSNVFEGLATYWHFRTMECKFVLTVANRTYTCRSLSKPTIDNDTRWINDGIFHYSDKQRKLQIPHWTLIQNNDRRLAYVYVPTSSNLDICTTCA